MLAGKPIKYPYFSIDKSSYIRHINFIIFWIIGNEYAKISGNWLARLQLVSTDGDIPRGSLIKEKAGLPVPPQALLPKLTSIEFCAKDLLHKLRVNNKKENSVQVNFLSWNKF